jgi:hypothetical protein
MNNEELANDMTIEDILILIKIKQNQTEQKEGQVEKVCISLMHMGYTEGSPLLDEAEKELSRIRHLRRTMKGFVKDMEAKQK